MPDKDGVLSHRNRARWFDVAAASAAAVLVAAGGASSAHGAHLGKSREVQAHEAVVRFINAFNRHDVRAALAFFTTDPSLIRYVGGNDCDFARGRTVAYRGRAELARWLRERAADHDVFTIRGIRLIGTQPAAAAVTYWRRRSDTLASLGFPDGIEPNGSKVGFTLSGRVRLTQFTNAAGDNRPCGP